MKKIIAGAAILGVLVAMFLALRSMTRPDFGETLTALNNIRSVIPHAQQVNDFARERSQLDGLLLRNEKRLSGKQRQAWNEYRFYVALFATDLRLWNEDREAAFKGGLLPDPQKRANTGASAVKTIEALNALEAALK